MGVSHFIQQSNKLKSENKIKQNVWRVLLEGWRKVFLKNPKGDWENKCLILSMPSEIKEAKEAGYVLPSFGEPAKTLNWYKLTPKGIELMKQLNCKVTEDINLYIFCGHTPQIGI